MPEIPEMWIGEEVTVFYSHSRLEKLTGILESVDEQGIVLRSIRGASDEPVYWCPITSVIGVRYPPAPTETARV